MVSELFTHLSNKWKNGGGNRSPPPVACHVIDWQMSVSELKTIKRRLFTLDDPQMVAVYHLWSSFLLFCGRCGGGGASMERTYSTYIRAKVSKKIKIKK